MKKVSVIYPSIKNKVGDEPKKLRVAAYCRVSTNSEEQLSSCKAQVEYYDNLIRSRDDYILVNIYIDEGISGTSALRREGFKNLISDCRKGLIDMVITKSVSRFGRNTVDCLNSVRELRSQCIDVFFEKENIHTIKSEGELFLTLISAVAQNESLNLSQNIKWGIRRCYEQGKVKSLSGKQLYGYDRDNDGIYKINLVQAEVIKRIYTDFLDGYGIFQIAKRLETEKIPTVRNGQWSPSAIRKILTNEKMKGDTLFQKTYIEDHLTHKRVKNKGELPQHYFKATHDGIIDSEIWECVQLELQRQNKYCREHNISKYHYYNEEHPLSARIMCATCGCSFILLGSKRIGEEGVKFWRCSSFKGNRSKIIEGKMFTPKPMALWSKAPDSRHALYRAKHRKLPEERKMLCSDIWLVEAEPTNAFIQAWNSLTEINIYEDYDTLKKYRMNQLNQMRKEYGQIAVTPPELIFKTLDHFEVESDGKINVRFLAEI